MKTFLKEHGSLIATALIALLVTIGAVAWLGPKDGGEQDVTVKVTQPLRTGSIRLQPNPEVTVSVVKEEAGGWKADDSMVVRSKWPCATDKFACEWINGITHPAMAEANNDASELRRDRCYVVTLNRTSASTADFNSEMYDPREVPCSP